jgi:IS5 family transposase
MNNSFKQFGIKLAYEQLEKKGDRLQIFDGLINWSRFQTLFFRRGGRGRPSYNPVMMFKVLILQHLYGIADEEVEYQIVDRISFQRFLGFPEQIPDHTTIWRFREYLSENSLHDVLWNELNRQIQEKGIQYSKGVIQDASFITANPGKTNSSDKIDRGRGQPTTRNEDGTWATKNKKSYFGYKLHAKTEIKQGFITELAVTTASTHDNCIDLSKEDEIVYRDKGYFGALSKAQGDATMERAVRGRKLTIREILRNKRITKIRSVGERPFAVIKNVLKGGHTLYTELHRVFTQQFMNCFVYNLLQLARVS